MNSSFNATTISPTSPTARETVAELENVTRRFATITALEGLSLSIRRGETVALLGPNGAGKTTAVEILLGLARPDSGRVRLFGGAPADAVQSGRVGAMLQDAGLPQGVKVAEIIDLVRGLYRDPLPLADVLRLSDLGDVAGRQVQRLSGGQRQRVRLALALAGNPELVALDEPTAALDVEARRLFWQGVRSYVSGGRTVLFATHRLEEADVVADRVVVLANGRVVADGTPDAVKAQVKGPGTVRITARGSPTPDVLERLPAVESIEVNGSRLTLHTTDPDTTVRALLHHAPQVRDLEVTRSGLEAAFLALTEQGASP